MAGDLVFDRQEGRTEGDATLPSKTSGPTETQHSRYLKQHADSARTPSSEAGSSDHDPFVAFKSFVDAQFDALLDGIRMLPQNIAELQNRIAKDRKRWTNNDGAQSGPPTVAQSNTLTRAIPNKTTYGTMNRERARVDAIALASLSQDLNATVSTERIHALYHDESSVWDIPDLAIGGLLTSHFSSNDDPTGIRQSALLRPLMEQHTTFLEPRWLTLDWFNRSAYSPYNLDHDAESSNADSTDWKDAFEDLVDTSLDKPVSIANGNAPRRFSSGSAYALDLLARGILPPLFPSVHRFAGNHEIAHRIIGSILNPNASPREASPFTYNDLEQLIDATLDNSQEGLSWSAIKAIADPNRAAYEADDYGALLQRDDSQQNGDQYISDTRPSGKHNSEMLERLEQEMQALGIDEDKQTATVSSTGFLAEGTQSLMQEKKCDVLSSLTTTHTTRLPDGTTTTKVVLRQRFADGREEMQEKVHTYVDTTRSEIAPPSGSHEGDANTGSPPAVSTSSWFWR